MDKCIKHNLPFDEMGYCDGGCSAWKQFWQRITELEAAFNRIMLVRDLELAQDIAKQALNK